MSIGYIMLLIKYFILKVNDNILNYRGLVVLRGMGYEKIGIEILVLFF